VVHDTFLFNGTTADGTSFSIHALTHLNTTPNTGVALPHMFDTPAAREIAGGYQRSH
jgi:hypothetical protein